MKKRLLVLTAVFSFLLLIKALPVRGAGETLTIDAPVVTGTNSITSAMFIDTTSSPTYMVDPAGNSVFGGNLTIDTNTLFVDATNNRVGIGTTGPDNKLEVESASLTAFTGTNLGTLAVSGDAYTVNDIVALDFKPNDMGTDAMGRIGMLMTGSGSYLQFGTSNNYGLGITNTAMTIDYSGNVGIGTTAPGGALDVASAAVTNGYWLDGKAALTGESADNWLRLNQSSSWTSGVYTPGLMRADGGFNVDSTTAISANNQWHSAYLAGTYDVFGKVNASGFGVDANNNATYDLLVYDGGNLYTKQIYFGYGGAATIATYDTNENLAIMPNGTGNVGIGTISPGSGYKLDVYGNANISGTLTLGASTGSSIAYVCTNSAITLIGQTTVCVASDARLKTNIDDISHQRDVLSDLQKLRGVYYNWDLSNPANKGKSSGRQVGMIAQDVEKVLPELVSIGSDGYRSFDYPLYAGFLTEVAKAQQTQITSLQSITTDFIGKFKEGLIETKRLIVDGVDILKKLNELSVKVELQQKQIEELREIIKSK